MRALILIVFAAVVGAQPPAGTRPALRSDAGTSILPGGREITPLGEQFFTGPGPFGLAISPDGKLVVTADGGPNRYALTVLENSEVRQIAAHRKRDQDDAGDDDADWQSVFMGLAFSGDRTVFASEGETGKVRLIDAGSGAGSGARLARFDLNQSGFRDSYTADLAYDRARGLLYVVDQANFRLAAIDTKQKKVLGSVRTGRLPFAVALSADGKRAYVTNAGMFEYQAIPGADPEHSAETGLAFPAFGFPSNDAVNGVERRTAHGAVKVPGLGPPNAVGSNSIAIVDLSDPSNMRVIADVPSGLPFGGKIVGGSSPCGVVTASNFIYASNSNQDIISVIDAHTLKRASNIELRIKGYELMRGVLPIGMTITPDSKWLLVAEAGINALGVIDLESNKLIGHIPAGWFPTQVRVLGNTVFVANAKGHGTGPNADRQTALARSFQGELRRGTISRFPLPTRDEIAKLTQQVMDNNGFHAASSRQPLPPVEHVVIIVKENRTYDEVFGDLAAAANGPRNGAPALARWGASVTPNHHSMATRWATSDNFYADSEVSVDGHHWLVGSYPNAWTESSLMAAYGGQKEFRLPTTAPGRLIFAQSNSSVHPEDQLEAGTIWHHLERNGIKFLNFGEGFELSGISEAPGLEPTGARFLTNVPMPDPLYRNTSQLYPGFNTNIPDQYRATQFIAEIEQRFVKGKEAFPQLIFIHLPNDHTAKVRPADGYPQAASYVADNDLALGRIIEYLSHSAWWPKTAVFVTEDDSQSGVDHVDSHRTVLMVASPYARHNYSSHVNTSFPGLLKTAFELLHLGPLNLYDAAAADLSDCFLDVPDVTPYDALPVDKSIFDPAKARIDKKAPPGPAMDDPAEIARQHRERN